MVYRTGDNNFGTAKWIVDATAGQGTHTTIATALTSASSGDTIFIRPGTYTENLTLKAGVNLTAYVTDSANGTVTIIGKATLSAAGTVNIAGIRLQTNSDFALVVSGSNASIVELNNCYLNFSNNTGISFTASNAGAQISFFNCVGNLGTTGIAIYSMSSTGTMQFFYSYFGNSGSSLSASSNSAGLVNFYYGYVLSALSTSSTGSLAVNYSGVSPSALNVVAITTAGSVASSVQYSTVSSGSASAVSIGAGTSVGMNCCDITSTNTNAITGAGTLNYSDLTFFGSSSTINTTTKNQQSNGIPFSVANGGTGAATLTGVVLGNGTSAMTTATYASGTFTPGLAFGGGTTGITYLTQSGDYLQIGNCVFFKLEIAISSKGSSTGNATITGFPVSTGSNGILNNIAIPYLSSTTLSATNLYGFIEMNNSATTTNIYQTTIAGVVTNVTNTNFSNTTQIGITGHYFTT